MSLGYIKGKYWVVDEWYAGYTQLAGYKSLMRATTLAGFGTNVEYSYTSRLYMAEITTIERFQGSNRLYTIKHNNAYHANPLEALVAAVRASGRLTPLVSVCCLELECVLLRESLSVARKLEVRLDATLQALDRTLDGVERLVRGTLFERMSGPPSFECEDCIGMQAYGCYCAAMGAIAPGGPLPDEDDDL